MKFYNSSIFDVVLSGHKMTNKIFINSTNDFSLISQSYVDEYNFHFREFNIFQALSCLL